VRIASFADQLRPRTRLRDFRARRRARAHALPDFFILGVQKAGTTSLFEYLGALPGVIPPVKKELHFFTEHSALNFYDNHGLDWYRSQFPLRRELRRAGAITGEATPRYMCEPIAMNRIAQDLPPSRWIVILRDPSERARSQYEMRVRKGIEKRTISEAMRPHLEFLSERTHTNGKPDPYWFNFGYLARGFYVPQLSRIAEFRRATPTLVLFSEHLFVSDPMSLSLLHSFLGLPEPTIEQFPHAHRGDRTGTIDAEVHERLAAIYAQENVGLTDLLRSEQFVTVDSATWPDWIRP